MPTRSGPVRAPAASANAGTRPGLPAIYTGTSFALCLLEVLVHANRLTPPTTARVVEALVPDDVSRESFDPRANAGWDNPFDVSVAQAYGRTWLESRRSVLLLVPSVVTGGRDLNAIVNPAHPDARRITAGPELPATFDPRLFPR